jgi:DNA-binding transcriptional ArsR family regulator
MDDEPSRRAEPGAVLFGPVRQALVIRLFGQPDRPFDVPGLVKATGFSRAAVLRELTTLENGGLLRRATKDGKVVYRADRDCAACGPLCDLARVLLGDEQNLSASRGPAGSATSSSPRSLPRETAPPSIRFTKDDIEREGAFVSLTLNAWVLRHLGRVYQQFDGDFLRAVVLGEVAHHNLSALAPALDFDTAKIRERLAAPDGRKSLLPCNAFSISQATGIPRETVRRKIKELVEAGLLFQDERRELYFSIAAAKYRASDEHTLAALNEMIETVDRLLARVLQGRRR